MKKNVPKKLQAFRSLFDAPPYPAVSKPKCSDTGYIFKGILF